MFLFQTEVVGVLMSKSITDLKIKLAPPDFGDDHQNQVAYYLQIITSISLCSAAAVGITYFIAGRLAYVLLMVMTVCSYGTILGTGPSQVSQPWRPIFLLFLP